jgi:hypothetical protein
LLDSAVGDLTMWIRAALRGWRFEYVDEPLVSYQVAADQLSWTDDGIPGRVIAALERFRFDDPVCEQLRLSRLSEARLARANIHGRHRRLRAGLHDLARARRELPGRFGSREWLALSGLRSPVVRWTARRPALLPFAVGLWRRLRPAVEPAASRRYAAQSRR